MWRVCRLGGRRRKMFGGFLPRSICFLSTEALRQPFSKMPVWSMCVCVRVLHTVTSYMINLSSSKFCYWCVARHFFRDLLLDCFFFVDGFACLLALLIGCLIIILISTASINFRFLYPFVYQTKPEYTYFLWAVAAVVVVAVISFKSVSVFVVIVVVVVITR